MLNAKLSYFKKADPGAEEIAGRVACLACEGLGLHPQHLLWSPSARARIIPECRDGFKPGSPVVYSNMWRSTVRGNSPQNHRAALPSWSPNPCKYYGFHDHGTSYWTRLTKSIRLPWLEAKRKNAGKLRYLLEKFSDLVDVFPSKNVPESTRHFARVLQSLPENII